MTLKITMNVTLPPVLQTLLTGFTLSIKNSLGVTITGPTDANLKNVEVAVDPNNVATGSPVTGGLVTSAFPTTAGTAAIVGNTDGVGTQNAQYQFTFTPTLPIPAEGVLTMTVPSGITVPGSVSLTSVCN